MADTKQQNQTRRDDRAVTHFRRDRARDWDDSAELAAVTPEFVFVHLDEIPRRWACKVETFPHYELVYVYGGELRMWLAGTTHRGESGDLFVVKPGVPHREESPPDESSQLLCLATAFRRRDGTACEFPLPLPDKVHVAPGDLVERSLQAIAAEVYHKQVGYSAAIAAHTMRIFIDLLRAERAVQVPAVDLHKIRRTRLVSDARRFIQENLATPLSLAHVAQHFFVSPFHFSRVFKNEVGVSPMAYLTQARMERARQLLLEPDATVKAVAMEVGYPDSHYFAKVFVREQGLTPTEFQRRNVAPTR